MNNSKAMPQASDRAPIPHTQTLTSSRAPLLCTYHHFLSFKFPMSSISVRFGTISDDCDSTLAIEPSQPPQTAGANNKWDFFVQMLWRNQRPEPDGDFELKNIISHQNMNAQKICLLPVCTITSACWVELGGGPS